MVVGFEFAIELTFPLDETTTIGVMNSFTQGLGVIITIILAQMNQYFGPFYSLLSQVILLLFGAVLTQLVPNEKLRQRAFMESEKQGKLLENKV